MQDSPNYTVDLPGLHARVEALSSQVAVLTNVVSRLVAALDTPAIRASVESASAIQACLLRSCEHTAKRLETLSRYEHSADADDGPGSLADMMELARSLGAGGAPG